MVDELGYTVPMVAPCTGVPCMVRNTEWHQSGVAIPLFFFFPARGAHTPLFLAMSLAPIPQVGWRVYSTSISWDITRME